ncbi:MAG: branched-chain amino acid ABC transporter permease [Myxococcales bacterium]
MTRWILWIVVVALALLLPHLMYPTLAVEILCGGLFALAFDLVFGYVGLLSFGHAAFWGTGSYVVANLLQANAMPVPFAIVVAAVAALVISIPMGYLSIRSAGIYFSMITLAFAEMIHFVALQADRFTGGENGIPGISRKPFLGINFYDNLQLYYFALAFVAVGFWIASRTIASPFGQALRAIRDNRVRAQSVGYNPRVQILVAFVISAFLSGLAGALNTVAHGVVSLDAVHWRTSGDVVMMTLLGGSTTLVGPFVGAAVVRALEHFLATSTAAVGIVTGAVFVVTVLFFRRGVVGSLLALDHYFASRAQVKALARGKRQEPQPGEASAKS